MADVDIRSLARADYLAGMTFSKIAAKYGVSEGTIKSWAHRDGWKRPKKKYHTQPQLQQDATTGKEEPCSTVAVAMIYSVEENDDLSDREKEFCLRYVKTFNATQSYLRSFNCSYAEANGKAYKLLKREAIVDEIKKLKAIKAAAILADPNDVLELYMRIAFADMTDFVSWGVDERKQNYRFLIPSELVDGQLVTEFRDGCIKLADRMKALEWLSNYFEMNPYDKHRDEYERRKVELAEQQLAKKYEQPERKENNLLDILKEDDDDDVETSES